MAINNKDVEVLSEALFCYYFAIYKNNKQKEYNFSEWARIKTKNDLLSFTGKYGITHIVKHVNDDPAFVSRIPKVVEFLVNIQTSDGFHLSLSIVPLKPNLPLTLYDNSLYAR